MIRAAWIVSIVSILTGSASGQWVVSESGTKARLRGVSSVDGRIVWAGGSGGTFLRTTDGGGRWQVGVVPGAEGLDFRDLHAVDADSAIFLSIGEGEKSRVYATVDGGETWSNPFVNRDPRVFLDAIAFGDRGRGLALGDPVDGRFTVLATADGGKSWSPTTSRPSALPGEGAFAASGTCLVTLPGSGDLAWFGTGGGELARVHRSTDGGRSWSAHSTPIRAGTASSGVFSIAFRSPDLGVAVGGDYKTPGAPGVVALTRDGGRTWTAPKGNPPGGYRSAVAYLPLADCVAIVAVGPTGGDISADDGETWRPLGPEGFHALGADGRGNALWAVGEDGRVARLRLPAFSKRDCPAPPLP